MQTDNGTKQSTNHDQTSTEDHARNMLLSMFKCSICLSTATLPAAVCSRCYIIIGCVPCIEQWHASSGNTKCPLCRTQRDYNLFPMVREIANIIGQAITEPEDGNDSESTTGTIAYNIGDDDDDDDDDADLLRPMI